MLRYRISITLIQIAALVFALYLGLTDSQYSTNYFLIGYVWIILFTLPSLISKLVFNRPYLSVATVASYLYYPISYIIVFFVTKTFQIDLRIGILALSIFTVLIWNLLFLFITFSKDLKTTKLNYTFLIGILLLTFGLFNFFQSAGRSRDSIVANDYLVHKTVVYPMATNSNSLCLLPSQCSNLFLIDSYTSFYHTFIIQPIEGFRFDPIATSYILDIIFSSFAIIIAYHTAKRFGLKGSYPILAALTAFAVFDSGAFTETIFIPQTLAFLLALVAMNSEKLNWKALALVLLILLPIHFIMGIYCFLILAAYYLIVEKDIYKKFDIKKRGLIALLTISSLLVTLLTITGFGIEKVFQTSEIEKLGFATNYYFPNNIRFIFEMFGIGTFILIACIIYYYFKSKESKVQNFLLTIIFAELFVYLLGPIYANKFLIGIGVFAAIFIGHIISNIQRKEFEKFAFAFYTLILIALSFVTQYRFFLEFYTQSNGETSAIVNKDLALVNYLKGTGLQCNYISDPQTQLTISSLADKTTASGHYMSLDSRRRLFELIKEPTSLRLSNLYSLTEYKNINKRLCLVYSARLKQYVETDNQDWTFNIYNYIVDYNKEVNDNDKIAEFLKGKNINTIYKDNYYRVYLLPIRSN